MNTRVKSPSMHFFFLKEEKNGGKTLIMEKKKTCILKKIEQRPKPFHMEND